MVQHLIDKHQIYCAWKDIISQTIVNIILKLPQPLQDLVHFHQSLFFPLNLSVYNREYLTLNKNHQVIQSNHSTLELLFWVYCFVLLSCIFSTWQVLRSNMFIWTSWEQICVAHYFYCFLCSWIPFSCLYLNNHGLISFFYWMLS